MDDRDGFDQYIPDELKAWFASQGRANPLRHYILKNGKIKAVDLMDWAAFIEGPVDNRRVDYTDISNEPNYPGGDFISTVFLGLDHNFDFSDPFNHKPILFESMVFGGKYDQRGWRYASFGEAKQGHWQIVDCIRAGREPQVSFGERPWFELFMDMLKDDDDADTDKDEEI